MTVQDRVAELLTGYPVQVEIPVAWGDMDAMGHVNNTVYFRYFETARIRCFGELGLGSIEKSGAYASGTKDKVSDELTARLLELRGDG